MTSDVYKIFGEEKVLFTQIDFSDLYLMGIFSQLSDTENKNKWDSYIRNGNISKSNNTYFFLRKTNRILWTGIRAPFDKKEKFFKLNLVDFLWEIL